MSLLKKIRFSPAIFGIFSLVISAGGIFNSTISQYDFLTKILLFIYGFTLLAWILCREYYFSRKVRFAEANIVMCESFKHLKLASNAIESKNRDLAKQNLALCLEKFSKAFAIVTGVNCSACIKSVNCDDNEKETNKKYRTKTFIRHSSLQSPDSEVSVPVAENTDFCLLTTERCRQFWLSNDISKEHNYRNSSLEMLKTEQDWQRYFRGKEYKYISTIVWPISNNFLTESNQREDSFIGFLCVDSKKKNIFNCEFDVHLGVCLSEALFPVLIAYSKTFIKAGSYEKKK